MKSLLQHYKELQRSDWDYYFDIHQDQNALQNPFLTSGFSHEKFIREYFQRGEKSAVIETIDLEFNGLRYPNHINSVFFLGLLFYYKTGLHKKFGMGRNKPGYQTFPFIWFLTALYHDMTYHIEKDENLYLSNPDLAALYRNYRITENLFEINSEGISSDLMNCCENYYDYRIKEKKVIDHGIFAGTILYDRLVKIRREKSDLQKKGSLFWDKSLESQYKLAASAIATHNMWIPEKVQYEMYKSYQLQNLIDFTPIKFADFKFLYLLGVIDTIDPIKTFISVDEHCVLENLLVEFKSNSVIFSIKQNQYLDFGKLIKKAASLHGWLNVKVIFSENLMEIKFR